jgi:N-acetylmuramoyl-L-alanine amidase
MIPIFDNGHGGVIGGVYQTAGKRSPQWECGVLYEGEFNRVIVDGVIKKLKAMCKPYYHACPELEDISLKERVKRTNKFYNESGKKGYLISIHANAGGGTGWEIFTSPGQTSSDAIAEEFAKGFQKNLPEHRARVDMSDGDLDKEERFYVLTQTAGPAILVEVAFMDNKDDYKKLWDETFRQRVIDSLVESILKLY